MTSQRGNWSQRKREYHRQRYSLDAVLHVQWNALGTVALQSTITTDAPRSTKYQAPEIGNLRSMPTASAHYSTHPNAWRG
jgi:hypothetical protein